MIKRYQDCTNEAGGASWSSMEEDACGEYVRYADHEADVAAAVAMAISDHAAEVEVLRVALEAAAKSLNTIAALAGSNEYLDTWENLRGYAGNRAYVANQALAARTAKGEL